MLDRRYQPDVLGSLNAAQPSIWAAPTTPRPKSLTLCRFCGDRSRCRRREVAVACEAAAARLGRPCARLPSNRVFIADRALPQTGMLRFIDVRAGCVPVAAASSWIDNDYRQPIHLVRDRLTEFALLRITAAGRVDNWSVTR
jgi:hypothetical protein